MIDFQFTKFFFSAYPIEDQCSDLMRCVAQFSAICTIQKTWKTPMAEGYFLKSYRLKPAALLKVTLLYRCFRFSKWYKRYQIVFSVPIPRYKSRLSNVNHAFLTWMYFTPLWRTIENSGQAGEDRLEKIMAKWKRNKNLKMLSFCVVFNCSNRADREKDKSNYRLP